MVIQDLQFLSSKWSNHVWLDDFNPDLTNLSRGGDLEAEATTALYSKDPTLLVAMRWITTQIPLFELGKDQLLDIEDWEYHSRREWLHSVLYAANFIGPATVNNVYQLWLSAKERRKARHKHKRQKRLAENSTK